MVIPQGVVEKIATWGDGNVAAPQRVLVYPTSICNLRCVFCYQSMDPYPYDSQDLMSDEKWIETTTELSRMGINTLQISGGGEPMLRGDLVLKMMEIAKSHGVTGRLVNNGTQWRDAWIRKVIDLRWDNVIFSVDGASPDTHDRMRGKAGLFKKTTGNIRRFTELKQELGTEKPLLEFSHVLSKWNFEQTPQIVELAHELGVGVITFEPVFVSNPFVHKIKLSRQDRIKYMTKIVPKAIELAEGYRIRTNLDHVMDLKVIEQTGDLKEHILAGHSKGTDGEGSQRRRQDDASDRIMNGEEDFQDQGASSTNAPMVIATVSDEPEPTLANYASAESSREKHELKAMLQNEGVLDIPCYESWLWPKIEANGDIGPCSTNMLKENIKGKTFRDVWYGPVFMEFRRRIIERDLPDGCENCVGTHLAWNREIRGELESYYKNDRKRVTPGSLG